ncbi:hypothetical protein CSUB01_12233 [Colletotrichum sublineola]|uniref:Uncharacterized protein n=1 Tax=Colletotrichum sublineola TaxID=1173701 RepID=A0A066WWG7_COLSU|nr:hypothetical protein CSUB01_12233 [Colletotrichum sublineola]
MNLPWPLVEPQSIKGCTIRSEGGVVPLNLNRAWFNFESVEPLVSGSLGHRSASTNRFGETPLHCSTRADGQATMPANSKSSSPSSMASELRNMGVLSASNLGKAAPFLAALEEQLYQSIVPRRSTKSSVPVDEAISMARQQQTVDSDDNDDGEGSALSNYFRVPYKADGSNHPNDEVEEKELEEDTDPETEQKRRDIAESFWFLRDFIEARWPVQLLAGYIKIQCDLTLDEIKELGHLDKAEGSRKCRKLVSAPVIHDEIGYALWSELAREVAARGDAPGNEDVQLIKATHASASLTKTATPPAAMSKLAEEEVTARRARSMRRRATDGGAITVQPRPRMSSTYVSAAARTRRKSDMQLVQPHQVICTTCGSRAVPRPKDDDYDDDDLSTMSDDEYEDGLESRERKRDSISRRLSVKMNRTLTKFGEGLATGYGGNGVSRVTG